MSKELDDLAAAVTAAVAKLNANSALQAELDAANAAAQALNAASGATPPPPPAA